MGNKNKGKPKAEETIATNFLVPIREDADVGHGRKHSQELWGLLRLFLENLFGGHTRSTQLYPGTWLDRAKNKVVPDESIKYFVDVRRKDLKKIKELIQVVAIMFKQKCIRFEYEGRVELIYSHEMWRSK